MRVVAKRNDAVSVSQLKKLLNDVLMHGYRWIYNYWNIQIHQELALPHTLHFWTFAT